MRITIADGKFYFDGQPTYSDIPGSNQVAWGRLMNSRMVQATFEDENPETAGIIAYPDGSPFDPERNTSEFIAMLPEYRRHGVIALTVCLQGGNPQKNHFDFTIGRNAQPWENNAFTPQGALKPRYAARMRCVIEASDDAGIALIFCPFYFGQDERLEDEAAVLRAHRETVQFLLDVNRNNILIEVNNECNIGYEHPILQPERVHELIHLTRELCQGRFLISTSYGGGAIPLPNVIDSADYILVHGNGQTPESIRQMVATVKTMTDKPIIFNEDSTSLDNMMAAWEAGASWGYFDGHGYQEPPVNWGIDTPEKRAFFTAVAQLVGINVTISARA